MLRDCFLPTFLQADSDSDRQPHGVRVVIKLIADSTFKVSCVYVLQLDNSCWACLGRGVGGGRAGRASALSIFS